MTSPSLSFRISRHTQDLAETVHALSQRLVAIEQRLGAIEEQLQAVRQQPRQQEEAEAASLAPIEAHIERLLQDCRQLLTEQGGGPSGVSRELRAGDEVDEPSRAASARADVSGEPTAPALELLEQDADTSADADVDAA